MNSTTQHPIGVFDSGVGGLTVLDALNQYCPQEHYVYYGDTLHMPYGNKSPEQITQLATDILNWLVYQQKAKLIAVACNTSAGVLYDTFHQLCPVPVVEPITPICHWISSQPSLRKIGLLATPTTIASNRYQSVLQSLNPEIEVLGIACEGLAKLIEDGLSSTLTCQNLLSTLLEPLQAWQPNAVILGCTHYPHAAQSISKLLPETPLLDPAQFMAQQIQHLLEDQTVPLNGHIDYHVSQNPGQFLQTSQNLPLRHIKPSLPQLTRLSQEVISS